MRNAALDGGRGIAAFMVLIGHATYFFKTQLNQTNFFFLLTTGQLCVSFFFALSGYVLSLSYEGHNRKGWIRARILRLYPMYVTCFFCPLIVVFILHNRFNFEKFPNSLEIALAIFGFQSVNSETYLLFPNPPLWSLSVEIILSFFLPYLFRIQSKKILFLILILSFALDSGIIPVLGALKFFVTGIMISKYKWNFVKIKQVFSPYSIIISYVLISKVLTLIHFQILHDLVTLFYLFYLIVGLLKLNFNEKSSKFFLAIGARSYAVYACQYPIIIGLKELNDVYFNLSPYICLILCLICIFIASEILLRLIDKPAIRMGHKFKRPKDQCS